MLWTAVISGLCVMAAFSIAAAQSSGFSELQLPWCTKNPLRPMYGPSVWQFKVAENRLHIVQASKQGVAKQHLSENAVVRVEQRQATEFVADVPTHLAANYYYLVRASAYDLDENYTIASQLEAYVFPEEGAVQIFNSGLSRPGATPKNFAVLVETDVEIHKAEIICLTAA